MQVSVIIPVYNAEKYIQQCINSVLAQTYTNYEIIIIDDGSTDSSGKICDDYAKEYSRIRVLHKENEGLICARRDGIREAKGQYISFVDADDWVESDFLETLAETMYREAADIVVTGYIREESDESIKIINNIKAGIYGKDDIEKKVVPKMLYYSGFGEFGILPFMWNKMYRKELLQKCYEKIDFSIYDGEDAAAVYPYLIRIDTMVVCEDAKYHYRKHSEAMTARKRKDYYKNVSKLYLYLYEEFGRTTYSECLLHQLDQYMRKMVWQGSPESFVEAERYVFPFDKVPKGSSIILYGAGYVGKTYYHQIERTNYCKVVAWVDREKKGSLIADKMICEKNDIVLCEFDSIVLAVADERIKMCIKEELRLNNPEWVII